MPAACYATSTALWSRARHLDNPSVRPDASEGDERVATLGRTTMPSAAFPASLGMLPALAGRDIDDRDQLNSLIASHSVIEFEVHDQLVLGLQGGASFTGG